MNSVEAMLEPAMSEHLDGASRIAAERRRQIEVEGYTPEHDAEHHVDTFVKAAGAYLGLCRWPWLSEYFKPDPADDGMYHERDLVKAGALIAAAIDRIAGTRPADTPAPALTDEQMGSTPADDAQIDDDVRALVEGESMPEETAWAIIAAVVARAKREERGGVMAWLYTLAANFTDPQASSALAYAAEMLAHKETFDE